MTNNDLRAKINAYIKANGNKQITGPILNEILNDTVNTYEQYDIHTYDQELTPTGNLSIGDIWYVPSETKLYRYNGTTWDELEIGTTITTANLSELTSSILTITGGTGAVVGSGTTIQVKQSSGSQDGYLSSANWTTFNSKQNALTIGNLTESTSSVLTITGGTSSIIGSGLSIQVKLATSLQSGYLSSTDWTTFNSKQNALTNPITGTGTDNFIAVFNGTTSLTTDSNLTYNKSTDLLTSANIAISTLINNNLLMTDLNGKIAQATLTNDLVWVGNSSNIPTETLSSISLSGKDVLTLGQCTISNTSITANSYAIATMSTVNESTSVPIKFTASAGSMVFSTGQITDTCDFGYIIFI